MKKSIWVLAVALTATLTANAQKPAMSKNSGEMDHAKNHTWNQAKMDSVMTARIKQNLGLTGDALTNFKTITKDARDQALAIHKDSTITSDQKMHKMKLVHAAKEQKIAALLTTEQYAEWLKMRNHKGGNAWGKNKMTHGFSGSYHEQNNKWEGRGKKHGDNKEDDKE